SVLFLALTEREDYLGNIFETENVLTIQNGFTITVDELWTEANRYVSLSEEVEMMDAFSPYRNSAWRTSSDVIRLKYGRNSFNTGVVRDEPIKKKYGQLLHFLQSGRCAVTGDKLNSETMQIDHIYPASKGGTNVLINMQAAASYANREKSDEVDESERRIFSDSELLEIGLDCWMPYPGLSILGAYVNVRQIGTPSEAEPLILDALSTLKQDGEERDHKIEVLIEANQRLAQENQRLIELVERRDAALARFLESVEDSKKHLARLDSIQAGDLGTLDRSSQTADTVDLQATEIRAQIDRIEAQLKRLNREGVKVAEKSLEGSQESLLVLVARKSDLELHLQFVNQARMQIANMVVGLINQLATATPDEAAALRTRVAANQQYDKILEIQEQRITTQHQAV
ncbi:hypothetical protein AC249_AIPGENE3255, partial [Exaiptasia diaphana]